MAFKRRQRRGHDDRVKARARRIMRLWSRHQPSGIPCPRQVGVNASTHCRPCSCWMCQAGNEVPPMRERAFDHPDIA